MMQQFWMARIAAGVLASVLVTLFLMGIIIFVPKPLPPLRPVYPDHPGREGTVRTYYLLGMLKTEGFFERGVPEGTLFEYYPNGSVYRECRYESGRLSGTVIEYYEGPGARQRARRMGDTVVPGIGAKGELMAAWNYIDGKKAGPYRMWHPDGTIREEGFYREGERTGRFRAYSREGRLEDEKFF